MAKLGKFTSTTQSDMCPDSSLIDCIRKFIAINAVSVNSIVVTENLVPFGFVGPLLELKARLSHEQLEEKKYTLLGSIIGITPKLFEQRFIKVLRPLTSSELEHYLSRNSGCSSYNEFFKTYMKQLESSEEVEASPEGPCPEDFKPGRDLSSDERRELCKFRAKIYELGFVPVANELKFRHDEEELVHYRNFFNVPAANDQIGQLADGILALDIGLPRCDSENPGGMSAVEAALAGLREYKKIISEYGGQGIFQGKMALRDAIRNSHQAITIPDVKPIDALKRLERAGTEDSKTNQKLIDAARRLAIHVFDIVNELGIPEEYHKNTFVNKPAPLLIGHQVGNDCFIIKAGPDYVLELTHYIPDKNGMCMGEACPKYDDKGNRQFRSKDRFCAYSDLEFCSMSLFGNLLEQYITIDDATRFAKAVANGMLDDLAKKIEAFVEWRNREKKESIATLESAMTFGDA